MTTYTYRCTHCGYKLDYVHGMNDSPKVKCPECLGKDRMERVIGSTEVMYKGKWETRDVMGTHDDGK